MRILLIRTSALGDVVHCLPVATALRRHLPSARLGWVVEEAMAPLLAGHPDLDELISVRLRPWRRRPVAPSMLAEAARSLAALRAFEADVALDLMGNHKGGVLAALSLADQRIGLARPFRREPESAVWISRGVTPVAGHAVERALSLLTALDLPHEPADFGGEKLFAGAEPWPERGFVLIHPGAGWGNKVYPTARWGEVARRLAGAGLAVKVAVAAGEESLATAVESASGGAAEPVEARDLATLGRLLKSAALVLAGDTGPLHLAHALGIPVLALMGPTDPRTHGPYHPEGGARDRALAVVLPCSFCHQRLDDTRACLLAIEPRAVAERALDLLARA